MKITEPNGKKIGNSIKKIMGIAFEQKTKFSYSTPGSKWLCIQYCKTDQFKKSNLYICHMC